MSDAPRTDRRVRMMVEHDWPAVEAIYAAGIAGGNATFESAPPTWSQFDATRLPTPRLVSVDGSGVVLGWIAATPVSSRPVYRGVVEHSVYVEPTAAGSGIGRALLLAFIAAAESAGIWTIQSGVFPENEASLRLHAAAGFRVVGTRERLGQHHGRWRDVTLIERRSPLR